MTRDTVLQWIERGLLTAGVVLGAWCAAVLVEARFHQAVPVAPLVVTQTAVPVLPGDGGSRAARPVAPSAPAAGSVIAKLAAPSVQMTTTVLEGSDDATLSRGAGHIEDTPFPGQPGNIGIAGYRISKTLIVGPDDVYVLDPTDHPTVTLVTCYPFDFIGHAPKRFIVQAELTDPVATETLRR
jgi:sortase (surface protein transpeptidase)